MDSSNQQWINRLWNRTIQEQDEDDYFANHAVFIFVFLGFGPSMIDIDAPRDGPVLAVVLVGSLHAQDRKCNL